MARLLARKRAEAEDVKQQIAGVDFAGLQDPGWSQTLPFPGLTTSGVGERPPREFEFVGRPVYTEIISRVIYADPGRESRGLLITGARGKGKSCLLRRQQRVICMDARRSFLPQIRDSLLLAFSDVDEAVQWIQRIYSVETLTLFLEGRKAAGDCILLVNDVDEKYDEEHKDRPPEANRWLSALERGCDFIIKTLSPEADYAGGIIQMEQYEVKDNFVEEERDSFLRSGGILGKMLRNHPDREEHVRLFAGNHPLSLFNLSNACEEYVRELNRGSSSRKRSRFGIHLLDVRTGREMVDVHEDRSAVETPEAVLDDEQDWQAVLRKFKQGEPFRSIRKYIREYSGPEERLRDPSLLSRCFVNSDGAFCSDFIHAVHLEAALERLKGLVFRSPAFREAVKARIYDPNVKWAQIGWACEGLVADAIMSLGLKFQGQMRRPVEVMNLDGEAVLMDARRWEAFKPVYLKPGKHCFRYIDGMLVWMDENKVLHLLALQVTVSPESHTKTEFKSMEKVEAERWYTGHCVWHYVYLCGAKAESLDKPKAAASSSRQGSKELVEYKREQLQLDQCFEQNLGQEELLLLRKLAYVREKEVKRRKGAKARQAQGYGQLLKSLPCEKRALYKRLKTRELLEAEAKKCGIADPSRKNYNNVYALLSAMNLRH